MVISNAKLGWLADYPDASSFLDLYKADASTNMVSGRMKTTMLLWKYEGKNANDKKAQYADQEGGTNFEKSRCCTFVLPFNGY